MFLKLLYSKNIFLFVNQKGGRSMFFNLMGYVFLFSLMFALQGFKQKANNEKDKNVLVKLNALHQYYIQHPIKLNSVI